MQQGLYKSRFLTLAENYHTKSVHAEWDGKKAEAQKYGRLCADEYVNALNNDSFEPEEKISLIWRAVIQHRDVRRHKTAQELSQMGVDLINSNEKLEKHRLMFEAFLNQ